MKIPEKAIVKGLGKNFVDGIFEEYDSNVEMVDEDYADERVREDYTCVLGDMLDDVITMCHEHREDLIFLSQTATEEQVKNDDVPTRFDAYGEIINMPVIQ